MNNFCYIEDLDLYVSTPNELLLDNEEPETHQHSKLSDNCYLVPMNPYHRIIDLCMDQKETDSIEEFLITLKKDGHVQDQTRPFTELYPSYKNSENLFQTDAFVEYLSEKYNVEIETKDYTEHEYLLSPRVIDMINELYHQDFVAFEYPMRILETIKTEFPSTVSKKFRFHALSLPHTVTRLDYCACAYTMKVYKFCKMMRERGHYIIHYGHEESEVDCDEHVTLTTNADLKRAYGSYDWRKGHFKHDINDHCHVKFNTLGVIEVMARIQPRDFVLPFWGHGAHAIVKAVNEDGRGMVVEPGIGYHNSFSNYRIYESWAVAHHTMGLQNVYKPSWYHCVIPNYFDPRDFDFSSTKEDYFLYLGRISACKGVHIAIQIIERIGGKLVVAGQGDFCAELGYKTIPDFVEFLGYADVEMRRRLLKGAKGLFLLSDYVEPFGGTAVESMMSGTPVIVPDYGAFTETVLHGVTGYRCRTFEQMCWAAKNIHRINSFACHQWAVNNFSMSKVSTMYEEFFSQIENLWRAGWYEENPERKELDWIYREYPKIAQDCLPVETGELIPQVKKPRIAIWSVQDWAFGRIFSEMIKKLSNEYEFTWYNWTIHEDNLRLLFNEWRDFDIIWGNTGIIESGIHTGYLTECEDGWIEKTFPLVGFPIFNHEYHTEVLVKGKNILYSCVCQEGVKNIREQNEKCLWTPCGVDLIDFPKFRNVAQIESLGFIGDHDSSKNKNYPMFLSIAERAGLPTHCINKRPFTEHKEFYRDMDLLICCSEYEGAPFGVLEAAACGIPVISTPVGNVVELENIKTFKTIDEAVHLIQEFNENSRMLQDYTQRLTDEVRREWSWDVMIEKYWRPALQRKLEHVRKSVSDTKINKVRDSPDRKTVREKIFAYIPGRDSIKFLDVGCEDCTEYYGLTAAYPGVFEYFGLDETPKIVSAMKKKGLNVTKGSINNIPFEDNFFEVVHVRHVLEHLEDFEVAVKESLRVSSDRVYISFSIGPNETKDNIFLDNQYNHSKFLIEEYIKEKVRSWEWTLLSPPSTVLLILKKDNAKLVKQHSDLAENPGICLGGYNGGIKDTKYGPIENQNTPETLSLLGMLLSKIKNGVFVEIGVFGGLTLLEMHKTCLINNITIYGIDPFETIEIYNGQKKDQIDDKIVKDVYAKQLANRTKLEKIIEQNKLNINLIVGTSWEAHKNFKDDSIDLLYIDGDHSYEGVKKDINLFWPKIKENGTVIFDDYDWNCVAKAANEFIAVQNIPKNCYNPYYNQLILKKCSEN